MDIEWDEEKRQQILMDRGVDLLWAALIFEGSTLTKQDTRHDPAAATGRHHPRLGPSVRSVCALIPTSSTFSKLKAQAI